MVTRLPRLNFVRTKIYISTHVYRILQPAGRRVHKVSEGSCAASKYLLYGRYSGTVSALGSHQTVLGKYFTIVLHHYATTIARKRLYVKVGRIVAEEETKLANL